MSNAGNQALTFEQNIALMRLAMGPMSASAQRHFDIEMTMTAAAYYGKAEHHAREGSPVLAREALGEARAAALFLASSLATNEAECAREGRARREPCMSEDQQRSSVEGFRRCSLLAWAVHRDSSADARAAIGLVLESIAFAAEPFGGVAAIERAKVDKMRERLAEGWYFRHATELAAPLIGPGAKGETQEDVMAEMASVFREVTMYEPTSSYQSALRLGTFSGPHLGYVDSAAASLGLRPGEIAFLKRRFDSAPSRPVSPAVAKDARQPPPFDAETQSLAEIARLAAHQMAAAIGGQYWHRWHAAAGRSAKKQGE